MTLKTELAALKKANRGLHDKATASQRMQLKTVEELRRLHEANARLKKLCTESNAKGAQDHKLRLQNQLDTALSDLAEVRFFLFFFLLFNLFNHSI